MGTCALLPSKTSWVRIYYRSYHRSFRITTTSSNAWNIADDPDSDTRMKWRVIAASGWIISDPAAFTPSHSTTDPFICKSVGRVLVSSYRIPSIGFIITFRNYMLCLLDICNDYHQSCRLHSGTWSSILISNHFKPVSRLEPRTTFSFPY